MAKTRSTLIAILLLLVVFGAGTYVSVELLMGRDLPMVPSRGKVGLVPLKGTLTSADRTVRVLEQYRENESVKALVLEIQSPGGTVGASQSLYREIREFRREADRPVVAWIGDVGASGGYYAALAADSIYALPGSITGSIGVIVQVPNVQGLADWAGVEVAVVQSGPRKDAGSPFRPLGEEDRAVFQQLVDDAYGQFLDAVVESRGMERNRARELADGRIYSGERARELGLVDRTGTLSEAVEAAGRMAGLDERPPTVRPGEREINVLDLLRGVSVERLRGWIAETVGWLPGAGGTPRLLYLWR